MLIAIGALAAGINMMLVRIVQHHREHAETSVADLLRRTVPGVRKILLNVFGHWESVESFFVFNLNLKKFKNYLIYLKDKECRR